MVNAGEQISEPGRNRLFVNGKVIVVIALQNALIQLEEINAKTGISAIVDRFSDYKALTIR